MSKSLNKILNLVFNNPIYILIFCILLVLIGFVIYLNEKIHNLVIYNSVIKKDEIQNMEGRLAWKLGCQKQLDIDHPFYNKAPSSNSGIDSVQSNHITMPTNILPSSAEVYSKIIGKNVLVSPFCQDGINLTTNSSCPPLEIKDDQKAATEKCNSMPLCDGYLVNNNTYQLRSKIGNPNSGQNKVWPYDWYLKVRGRCSNFKPNTNVPTPACPPGSDRCYKPNLDEAQALCDSVPSCTAVVLDNNSFEPRKGSSESAPDHYTWSCEADK